MKQDFGFLACSVAAQLSWSAIHQFASSLIWLLKQQDQLSFDYTVLVLIATLPRGVLLSQNWLFPLTFDSPDNLAFGVAIQTIIGLIRTGLETPMLNG